jgi:hypothetical protein
MDQTNRNEHELQINTSAPMKGLWEYWLDAFYRAWLENRVREARAGQRTVFEQIAFYGRLW